MIKHDKCFLDDLFEGYKNYDFMIENKLPELLGVSISESEDSINQMYDDPIFNIAPVNTFQPDYKDLYRLHWLVTSRRVTTILEFGVGKSTIIFNDALLKNKALHENYIKKNLRRSNLFECHSVDNYDSWIDEVSKNYNLDRVTYQKSVLSMGTFADKICTYYETIPNVCPDFIYLDGPDTISALGNVRGISTKHYDRLPMAADILAIEHFLLPGTLIVIDGRTANARFLMCNLQRSWLYFYDKFMDQHFLELSEEPLGIYNRRQIDYCLGKPFFSRVL